MDKREHPARAAVLSDAVSGAVSADAVDVVVGDTTVLADTVDKRSSAVPTSGTAGVVVADQKPMPVGGDVPRTDAVRASVSATVPTDAGCASVPVAPYRAEYAVKMLAFFSRAPYRMVSTEKYDRYGNVTAAKEEKIPCEFPTFARFAAGLGVCLSDLAAWRENAAFAATYAACEALQKSIAVENAMMGRYDASFVKFYLTNEYGQTDTDAAPFSVDIRVVDGCS